jgi:hypothetical protein
MNASLPAAAGLHSASGFIQACTRRGGAGTGGPSAAVVARDGVGSLRARSRSARALSATAAAVGLCALRRTEVSLARHGVAPARRRVGGAAVDGSARHVAQAAAHRRRADAARTARSRAACTARATHAGRARVTWCAGHAGSARHCRCAGHRGGSTRHRGGSAGHGHCRHAAIGSAGHCRRGTAVARSVVGAAIAVGTGIQVAGGVVAAAAVGCAGIASSSAGVRTWCRPAVVGPASPHARTECTR